MFTQKHIKGQLTAALAGSTMLVAVAAQADQQILDDLIVDGSACVGFDCVNGESFGFDTIRMKENNVRLHFNDTSTTASFPGNDWRIIANDTSNGGTNHLSIEDSTAGRSPFRVEAGASANALVVEADSDIGIGTLNPVVELHVVDGDSPTLRLQQDGSSGFTPQTFDLVSNEANFFIRDVTNGSQLPFRIKPGADSDSLFIAADNDIGIGTDSPAADADGEGTSAKLHLRGTDGSDALVVEQTNASTANRSLLILKNNGRPRILFQNTAASAPGPLWSVSGGPTFAIRDRSAGVNVMEIAETTGNVTISGSLTTSGGTCGGGCDAVFDPDFEILPIQEHARLMYENRYLPNVGPTPENTPINLSDKLGRMLNELEHAHIYIAELEERLSILEKTVN